MNLYSSTIIEVIRTTNKGKIIVAQSKLTKLEKQVISQTAIDNNKSIAFVTMNKLLELKNKNDKDILIIE